MEHLHTVLNHLLMGFGVALTPANVLYGIVGVVFGTFVGAMPGIGAPSGIAMLLPLTFGMNPTSGIIMLAGIYYGSQYGGSITSILVNVPGEASSVVTCLDGYQMALKGRAGAAMAVAGVGSFVAGTFGTILIMLMAMPVANFALRFGPAEEFTIFLLAFTCLISFASESRSKTLEILRDRVLACRCGVSELVAGTFLDFCIIPALAILLASRRGR